MEAVGGYKLQAKTREAADQHGCHGAEGELAPLRAVRAQQAARRAQGEEGGRGASRELAQAEARPQGGGAGHIKRDRASHHSGSFGRPVLSGSGCRRLH